MKMILVVTVVALMYGAMLYIMIMNRASEKVMTTAFSTSLAALAGLIVAVFVFGGEATLKERFPVYFAAFKDDKTPVNLPFRKPLEGYHLVSELQKNNPELMKDEDGGETVYHEFLQKSIIDSLTFRYRGNWKVEVIRYNAPLGMRTTIPDESEKDVTKFNTTQLEGKLQRNRFARLHLTPPELCLPPNSSLSIATPHKNEKGIKEGKIVIENPFVTLTIHTRPVFSMVGMGQYRMFSSLPFGEDQNIVWSYLYEIYVTAEFSRLRSGHPDMASYKSWAAQVISELKADFDEEQILEDAKQKYLFAKEAGQLNSSPLVGTGIGRFAPPQRQ